MFLKIHWRDKSCYNTEADITFPVLTAYSKLRPRYAINFRCMTDRLLSIYRTYISHKSDNKSYRLTVCILHSQMVHCVKPSNCRVDTSLSQ